MKNIIWLIAASTLLLASSAWPDVFYPQIDIDDGECYVFNENIEPVWVGVGINKKISEKEKAGITEIIATCTGKHQNLITDGNFEKVIHIDRDTGSGLGDCQITPEEGEDKWTSEWHQVLRKNGSFSLKCIKVISSTP